jgi:hypothetical protein
MLAADPPAVIATAPVDKPAGVVIVSYDTRSEILVSEDTPLPLIKARKTEEALVRQAIFLTGALTVERPAVGAGQYTLRWTYQPYLQRQFCVTSITGQFSCAVTEIEELTGKAEGETPLPATPSQATPDHAAPGQVTSDQAARSPNPAAEAARIAVATALRARADALFEDDRRLKLSPMLKAAGVSIRRISK